MQLEVPAHLVGSVTGHVVQPTSLMGSHTVASDTVPAVSISDEAVLRVIVEARGQHRLAQDILRSRYGVEYDLLDLVDVAKDRLPELKQQMEVVATLELFSLMPQLHKTLTENLSALEPADAVNAYMKLMDLITKQTSSNEININLNDQRFKSLPRDVQQTYAALEASGQLQKVIEHIPASSKLEDSDD